MKLRIRGSSLRLRLGRSEVARAGEGERVEDAIAFGMTPADRLVYSLVPSRDATAIRAHFAANEVMVTVPLRIAREWAIGDAVGLQSEQPIGDGTMLEILVEKDFACLKPRADENDTDAYPNPATDAPGSPRAPRP